MLFFIVSHLNALQYDNTLFSFTLFSCLIQCFIFYIVLQYSHLIQTESWHFLLNNNQCDMFRNKDKNTYVKTYNLQIFNTWNYFMTNLTGSRWLYQSLTYWYHSGIWDPLYKHGLTGIGTRICNCIHSFLRDVINHPSPDFNDGIIKPMLMLGHGWIIAS